MKPLVTIGIALYNHENYIKECLESIINQTYENIEIIAIDDGSKDNSYKVANEVLESSQNTKPYILKTRPNCGMCNTLNEIVELANGKYISFIGSDDFWHPNKTTKQVDFLESNPDIALVHSNSWIIDGNSKIYSTIDYSLKKHNGYLFEAIIDGSGGINTPCHLFRRNIYEKIGIYDPAFRWEDTDFWLRLTKVFNVGFINEKLSYYRIHKENLSNINNYLKFYNDEIIKIYQKNIDDHDLLKDAVARMYRKSYLRALKEFKPWYFIKNLIRYYGCFFIQTTQQKILIFRLSALGDLVTLETVFRAIRTLFPYAHITFITSSTGKELYADSGYFNRIITFRRRDIFAQIVKFLKYSYDITINLQGSRISHIFLAFVRAGKVVDASSKWWQRLFGFKANGKTLKNILIKAGVDREKIDNYLECSDAQSIKLPFINKSYNWIKPLGKTIALAPGSSKRWESKKWGDGHYLELAKKLLELNYTVLLVGSSLEVETANNIKQNNPNIINLVNQTTISELKSILAKVDILICNDSGPTHLAAGVGTDTLTIFGPTGKKFCVKNLPYSGKHICFTPINLACHPCYRSKCPTHHECMQQITVEQVFNTIVQWHEGHK